MKTIISLWRKQAGAMAVAMAALSGGVAQAEVPVVHVLATDPVANEWMQERAVFTVFRNGPTNAPLTVHYRLAGTAVNGMDYTSLSGSVTIPVCAVSAAIEVVPVDDALVEGTESVAIFLEPQYQWPPAYTVCWPSYALAQIQDNDFAPTNLPPVVRLVNPPDGSVFPGPTDLRLVAHATDFDGKVRMVEFFDGSTSLGVVSNYPAVIPAPAPAPWPADALGLSVERDPALYPELEAGLPTDPGLIRPTVFMLPWLNVPPGPHKLTAVATDDRGATARSDTVEIRVTEAPFQPVVNVRATDPVATEPGPAGDRLDTATFTISRTGPTELPLTVFYRLGGTASNGVDYRELPHSAVIPPGASSAEVIVAPIGDNLLEGTETVVLTLVPPVCPAIYPPPYDCYLVGRHDSAQAIINDRNPGNLPPVVEIVRPLDGSVFLAPAEIAIVASARDLDGRVRTVEFFEGTNSLGIVSNAPQILPTNNTPQFAIKWAGVAAGHYVLTAEATDDDGAKSRSRPVEIKVVERTLPPVVTIEATDPDAAEVLAPGAPDTATFTIKRTGPTERALTVFFSISGSASNGVDYQPIGGRVIIPPGAASAPVVVVPIDDRLAEGTETVALAIEPPPLLSMSPLPIEDYVIGAESRARAVIRDNDTAPTNQPPKVALVRPGNGEVFTSPADIRLCAEARDADGFVVMVEFFEGTNRLGVVPASITAGTSTSILPPDQIFCLDWKQVGPGGYTLTAKATDNRGASSVSEPVRIKVIDVQGPVVVTIEASDPDASEGDWIREPFTQSDGAVAFIGPPILERPNVAIFTVKRDRGTNLPLTVYYTLGGTASNGVDYRALSGRVTIPAGAWTANIVVEPIDDSIAEGVETVVAELAPIPCIAIFPPPPECYVVGDPAKAVAFIRDNDPRGQPPRVAIVKPEDGQTFLEPADVEVVAEVQDLDGYVTAVEFFAGTNSIGIDSRVYIVPPPPGEVHRFSIIWSNAPAGIYPLTAQATDSDGLSSRSAPIAIKVVPPCPVPVVSIEAIDKSGTERDPRLMIPDDPAIFRISRTCRTNEDLLVHYEVGGTAINGVDYYKLDGRVVIPAGSWTAHLYVNVLDDLLAEGTETVVIKLLEPDCLFADPLGLRCYRVGEPAAATAFILDNETLAPKVAIVKPESGERFQSPAEIPIVVQAVDEDGWVGRVEFFANGRSIGVQTINFIVPPPPGQLQRFSMVWSNVPAGRYVLTAQATDDRGTIGQSAPVTIEVLDDPAPPVVNIFATDAFAREGSPVNTAAFRIRRSGATNSPLTVHFAIQGTAVNGSDYVEIPASVTIPAGRRAAGILITPIDDRRSEPVETVILRLQPAALYNLGRWNRAGAIIVDDDAPRPGPLCLADRNFHLRLGGRNGEAYQLEVSTNLTDWEALDPNVVSDDAIHFVDPEASELGARFYRVRPLTTLELFAEE